MTHSNFQTNNKLGLPLEQDSDQTLLPVICGGNGNIRGFITIPLTTFDGTETSYNTSDGPIAITTVTLPPKVNDGSGYGVQQYMAAVFPDNVERLAPWLGYTAFVDAYECEYLMRWVMPTTGQGYLLNRGTLVTNLLVNMAEDAYSAPVTPPPSGSNATMEWAAELDVNSTQIGCGFFDILWTELFNAQSQSVDPLSLEIVSNPPGGVFKATMVPYPAVQPLGGVQFNTIRIIRLQEATPGAYVFTFKILDTQGQATTVTFTLNVVNNF